MARLDDRIAYSLAIELTMLEGFPRFFEAAIDATADDLVRWCTGSFAHGQLWSAEQQAYWLVREARKWMEWKGTGVLYALFKQQFGTTPVTQDDIDRLLRERQKPQ